MIFIDEENIKIFPYSEKWSMKYWRFFVSISCIQSFSHVLIFYASKITMKMIITNATTYEDEAGIYQKLIGVVEMEDFKKKNI